MPTIRYQTTTPEITLHGSKYVTDLRPHILSMEISRTVDQVSELTVSVDDPQFALTFLIGSPNGMQVKTMGLDYIVDSYDLDAGGGNGGMTLHCRPRTVRLLKNRTGAFVMKNVSPTTWVQNEIGAVGARLIAQPSATRATVARDVVTDSTTSNDENNKPSSWSTCKRLAEELGYLFYEDSNVYFFGKPSWLIANAVHARLSWKDTDPTRKHVAIPTYSESLDDPRSSEVGIVLPVEQAEHFYPGMRVELVDFPFRNTTYFLSAMTHPITPSTNDLSLTLKLPIDPEVPK